MFKIIFVREHLVISLNDFAPDMKVLPGRTGVLLDEANGIVHLDEVEVLPGEKQQPNVIPSGIIEGVQPSMYIAIRDDIEN